MLRGKCSKYGEVLLKASLILIVVWAVIIFYEKGHREGYIKGHGKGYKIGRKIGIEKGYRKGRIEGLREGYKLRIEDEVYLVPELTEGLRKAWEQELDELNIDLNSQRLIDTRKAILESLSFWQANRKVVSPIASK